jgi:hypothetical protein
VLLAHVSALRLYAFVSKQMAGFTENKPLEMPAAMHMCVLQPLLALYSVWHAQFTGQNTPACSALACCLVAQGCVLGPQEQPLARASWPQQQEDLHGLLCTA